MAEIRKAPVKGEIAPPGVPMKYYRLAYWVACLLIGSVAGILAGR
jgi:hypothetical protein